MSNYLVEKLKGSNTYFLSVIAMGSIGRDLIRQIEEKRKSKVIVYFTGDRTFASAMIAQDAVRPLYDHLSNLKFQEETTKRMDLFLYSCGGDVSVPWRIVSMIREFCDEFNVLIPYKAQSAATLLSLGADTILMGKKAELGPIDPTLKRANAGEAAVPPQEISVEDVNSFVSFIKERANINDQDAVAQLMGKLIAQVGPLTLGNVNRSNNHIRLVARKLLTSRKEKIEESKLNTVIETLTEKIYSHGHAIGRREAKEMGLDVKYAEEEGIEGLLWKLYQAYEEFLKIEDPIDLEIELKGKENSALDQVPVAVIESVDKLHVFRLSMNIARKRQVPPNLQMNVNLQLQMPPSVNLQSLPAQAQQILNEMMKQISSAVPKIVQEEIVKQSPMIGFDIRPYGAKWNEEA